ncbi:MAG: hypothetical protein ACTHKG_19385 [Nocardioides sp.]
MPDPFEPLKHHDEVSVPSALPAAEVRRRGDRLRRRRTTLRALGAACAVAVVVTGGVALGNGRPDASPPPPAASGTGDPTPDWTLGPSPSPDDPAPDGQALTVPDGFPLLEGVPDPDADSKRSSEEKLGAPRIFDPCHNNADAAVDAGRTDYLRTTQSGPAYSYVREVVVYESSSAANEAMVLAKGELERCPQYLYDDGVSRDVWEPSTVTGDKPPADDVILAVNHGYSDYGITTLATNWMVMRVGNALLTLAYDGEFGASKESVRSVATDELGSYLAIAPSMCAFADETTDIGCAEPSTAAGPADITDPGPAFLLDEATLRTETGLEQLETVPDSQTATLPCQAEWLSTFRADTADYRQFEARNGSGELTAWAGTAVLGFPDELAAGTAYDTVGEWLSQCEPQVDPRHRLVTAVDSGIGEPHITRLPDGIMSGRAVKLTAPERCVECDAAWDDYEGIAQVGRHLVLAHVAIGGDMQLGVDDSRLSLDGLLEAAADRVRAHGAEGSGATSQATTFLGPDGYGPLMLGMSAAEAEASGIVTLEDNHGDGCAAFGLLSADRKRLVGTGYLAPGKGVVAIAVDRGVETPQGIHLGSGTADVKRAYAHLTGRGGLLVAPASDSAQYVMRLEKEKVVELALAVPGQACTG